jgi:transcriptional regulator with XRE-family HTH domain
MHRRIKPIDTLTSVRGGESRYDEQYADHAREQLRKFLEARTQEQAAKLLRMNQSTISRNLDPARQPSIRLLIRLSEATGRTIDDLIGLRHKSGEFVRLSESSVMMVAKAVAKEVSRHPERRSSTKPPKSR